MSGGTRMADGSVKFNLGPVKNTEQRDCGCKVIHYQHVADLMPCAAHATMDLCAQLELIRRELRAARDGDAAWRAELARLVRPSDHGGLLEPLWYRAVRWVTGDRWLRNARARRAERILAGLRRALDQNTAPTSGAGHQQDESSDGSVNSPAAATPPAAPTEPNPS